MATAKLRPTFTLDLSVPADEAIRRIRLVLAETDLSDSTISAGRCAEFFVDDVDRRLWSPYLSVYIEPRAEGSLLRGRFSPRPDLWTPLMFVYILTLFVMLFGAVLGYVQWASSEAAWGFWFVPGGLALLGSLHLASVVGQRKGASQMEELRRRLDRVLDEALSPTTSL